jgi:hypothetical protein
MRSSPSSRDCRHAFVDIAPHPVRGELEAAIFRSKNARPGTNQEYREGEASPKFLPCLPSLLQPHFGAPPEVCRKQHGFFLFFPFCLFFFQKNTGEFSIRVKLSLGGGFTMFHCSIPRVRNPGNHHTRESLRGFLCVHFSLYQTLSILSLSLSFSLSSL